MKSLMLSRAVNFLTLGRIKYGWWTSSYKSESAPIIIGGCGRSGTTLLRAMLNAHPNIGIGPETGIFCGNHDVGRLANPTQLGAKVLMCAYRRSACLGEFIERIMDEQLSRSGKSRWGEKSPTNIKRLGQVFRFFPKAKVVHMIRDGRDVVSSLRDHPKYKWVNGVRVPTHNCNPWSSCIARWVGDTSAGLRWRGDARYREIRYEDLVSATECTLRSLLEWIDEPWDPAVLTFHLTHKEGSSDAANPGIKKAIYLNARDRWKSDLPSEAAECFSDDAHRLLIELGYADNIEWVSSLVRTNTQRGPVEPAVAMQS